MSDPFGRFGPNHSQKAPRNQRLKANRRQEIPSQIRSDALQDLVYTVDDEADLSVDERLHGRILHRKKEGIEALLDVAIAERIEKILRRPEVRRDLDKPADEDE